MKIVFASVTILLNAALIAGAATTTNTAAVVDTTPEAVSVSTVPFTAAIDAGSDKSSTRRRLQDDGPWEPGTPVSANFPDDGGWWDGVIAGYGNGAYTVQWSDGSTDTFADEDYVDEIVANANGPEGGGEAFFDMNTPISWQFDGEWWDGQITGYDGENAYTVTWEDNSTDEYTDINLLSQMVNAYVQNNADDTAANAGYNDYDPWDMNTPVYWHFQEDGHNTWWDGKLTNFDYVTGIYTVTWEDNSTDEYGPDDYDLVDQILQELGGEIHLRKVKIKPGKPLTVA